MDAKIERYFMVCSAAAGKPHVVKSSLILMSDKAFGSYFEKSGGQDNINGQNTTNADGQNTTNADGQNTTNAQNITII